MTVTSLLTKVTAAGNGVATSFSFSPIVIFADSDLEVTHVDADDVETILELGSGADNYSVTVASFPGTGSITYPASGTGKLATGESLVIRRVLPLTQETNLTNQGPYLPKAQENQFDRFVMIDQQQQEEIDRSVKVPVGSTVDIDTLVTALLQAEANAVAAQVAAEAAQAAAEAAAAGAGSPLKFLSAIAVPAAATFEITALGDTSHKSIMLKVIGLTIGADALAVVLKYRKNGSVKATDYHVGSSGVLDADISNIVGSEAATGIALNTNDTNWQVGNAAGEALNGAVEIFEPHESKVHYATVDSVYKNNAGRAGRTTAGYTYNGTDSTSPITGITFSLSGAGNFTGGLVLVYGFTDLTP